MAMTSRISRWRLLATAAALLAGATMTLAAPAEAQAHTTSPVTRHFVTAAPVSRLAPAARGDVRQSCAAAPAKGHAACTAMYLTDVKPHRGTFDADTVPVGYGPADLQSAYSLPSATAGTGQTVALIEAYDDPAAEADLAVYRSQYGLKPCTTANGCFRKVNQSGGTSYPAPNASWAEETSVDMDMVSAACPDCHILVVEANNQGFASLGAAVDEAVALGAKFVSNSYAGIETASDDQDYNTYYNHPGVAVVVSAGDDGYGVDYPAASSYVTAVGGTSLTRSDATARGWAETVWNNAYGGTGSGCSAFEAKPTWQHDTGCADRTVNDVSADADPATGVAVYDSYQFQGWDQFGGTSVGTPLITAAYALAGTPAVGTYPASYPYAEPSALNDVTTGADGSCTPDYLCTAELGYDGPTGLGTPDGVAAFTTAHGDITGTVTSAATGKPVKGAQVSLAGGTTTTNASGDYDLSVSAGSYAVTASNYTYTSSTDSGVTVTGGTTATADFSLTPQPTVTISGQVTDGSGHGWPLYAAVTASGVPGTVYTNPYTGRYTITVLPSAAYTLQVTSVTAGYQTASQQVSVATSNLTQNIAVPVNGNAGCVAPGYAEHGIALSEPFDGTSQPAGWTVTDGSPGWVFDDPGGRGNLTGGSGGFAIADPAAEGGEVVDSSLVSPSLNLSDDPDPVLSFDTSDTNNALSQVFYSTDGGSTWTTAAFSSGSTSLEGPNLTGPGVVAVSLPQAANSPDVQIEFTEEEDTSGFWELDNVSVYDGTCTSVSGGLVAGVVKDANTGAGLAGATVASVADPSESATTMASPSTRPMLAGFYELFAAGRGQQSFAISDAGGYETQAMTVRVTKNGMAKADTSLQAGDLRLSPATKLAATVVSGNAVTVPVTIINAGAMPASFTLTSQGNDGGDMAWLSESPTSGQVPAGGSTTVQVTMTSADTTGTGQPGSYTGSLNATTDTPYTPSLDVAMTVKPPASWGQITGTIVGATCDGGTTPLADATVEITAAGATSSVLTGDQGTYSWWLPQTAGSATVIASLNGWQAQLSKAKIKAGRTTTVNLTLQLASSCSTLRTR
ncbi:MAG TPA: carboxypeptidase regulatory-like domain-containing protein [Streptosporangiaceae bacterium]